MLRLVCVAALVAVSEGFAGSFAPLSRGSAAAVAKPHAKSSGLRLRQSRGAALRMADAEAPPALDSIELKNSKGHTTTVYPFGACVTSYNVGHEVLFVRPDAKFDGSKPISGGVPHCFPQFGPGEIQQHGFARNMVWDVKDVRKDEPDMPTVTMELTESEETMKMWPNKFKAVYTVGLEESKLNMELRITNTDDKDWDFQAALHTYFGITDIDKCEVRGQFKGSKFLNKMEDPPKETTEDRSSIRFEAETDSVYEGVTGDVIFYDEAKPEQSVTIRNMVGWEDTVLWNPYGNEGMGYKNFACVESVKAAKPEKLAPGETWVSIVSFIPGKPE